MEHHAAGVEDVERCAGLLAADGGTIIGEGELGARNGGLVNAVHPVPVTLKRELAQIGKRVLDRYAAGAYYKFFATVTDDGFVFEGVGDDGAVNLVYSNGILVDNLARAECLCLNMQAAD